MPRMPASRVRFLRWCLPLVVLFATGCAETRYYWQSASGHLQLMRAARPVDDWLADRDTPVELRRRLELARSIRAFAVTELGLPDNASYHRYADLRRRSVVWNVVATPPYSLKVREWCFPVLGCIGYRGYFSEADARAEATALQAEGLEVTVYGVPAYSTLGWTNWLGGDPLLNTFIQWPEVELARIIFHELAHQVVYAEDDTPFNESFATAVERLGSAAWVRHTGSATGLADGEAFDLRRRQFRALTSSTRERLRAVYAPTAGPEASDEAKAAGKARVMQAFRDDYARLRQEWNAYAGYDAWVAGANNASFAAQAAYDDLVPAFEALFEREGQHWPAFYAAVRTLATLPKDERRRQLEALRGGGTQARVGTVSPGSR